VPTRSGFRSRIHIFNRPETIRPFFRSVRMLSDEFVLLQRAVAGRYSLVEEIGRGGMGIVFAARDVALDRPVAIKLLPPSLAASEESRRRFLREARTAASLSHPHIVPIHAVEERDGLVFFVMALVDGESLGQRIRRLGPLPAREALRVVQEVAWALAYAHGRGIVHRDVKPDNILLEAGTGRALEVMASLLQVPLDDLGPLSLEASNGLPKISNTCVVFAKSEVLALARQGVPTRDILAALCDGVAERVKGLLRAVGVEEDFVISGGISKNVGVVRRVEDKLGTSSHICFEPQVVGAMGAALFARDFLERTASRER